MPDANPIPTAEPSAAADALAAPSPPGPGVVLTDGSGVLLARASILTKATFGGLVGAGLIGPNRPVIEAEFGLSHTAFGVGIAVAQLASAMVIFVLSSRLARLPPLPVLVAAAAVQTLGFFLIAGSGAVLGLALGWALVVGGANLGSVTNYLSSRLFPDDRQRGVNLLHFVNSVGKLLGPLLAAWALAALTWRWGFGFAGIVGIALAGLCLIAAVSTRLPADTPAVGPPPVASTGRSDRDRNPPGPSSRDRRHLFAVTLGIAMIAGGEAAFGTLLPVFLVQVRGVSEEMASLVLAVHLAGLVLGRLVATWLGRRASVKACMATCTACGVFVFPAVLLASPWGYVPAAFLLGGMFSATWPTFYAAWDASPARLGARQAYAAALGNVLGLTACIALSSYLADRSMLAALLFGPAVVAIAGLLFFLGPIRPPVPHPTPDAT